MSSDVSDKAKEKWYHEEKNLDSNQTKKGTHHLLSDIGFMCLCALQVC